MPYLLAGLLILFAILFVMHWYANANPQVLASRLPRIAGLACLAVAGLLTLRGLTMFSGPLAAFGAYLLLAGARSIPFGGQAKSPGQKSAVKTDYLEMELDHDTGAMSGRILKGQFFGLRIEDLTPADLASLWQECRFEDPHSAELVAAYLDSAHPTWRADFADTSEDGEYTDASGSSGPMTFDEALSVLGLDRSATSDDVRQAHKDLMQKVHPDRGGSTYLASKINAAKEYLLERMT